MRHCEPKEGAKMEKRLERRRQWRCFWTWPLGHCWHGEMTDDLTIWSVCCHCDKHHVSPAPGIAIPMCDPPSDWKG